jgi:hypothetical protein
VADRRISRSQRAVTDTRPSLPPLARRLTFVPIDGFKERAPFPYPVTYGWPGLPTTTKIVDLERKVTVGTQILVDGQWWRVTELVPPARCASHLGHVTALQEE